MRTLPILKRARAYMSRLIRDEAGSAVVEAAIVLPLLGAVYASSFVFFDATRNNTLAMKATYTVSDILSREDQVDEPFMNGLNDMMAFLVPSPARPKLRISLVTYNDDVAQQNKYRLGWSYATEGSNIPELTQLDLDRNSSWIPIMGDDETIVVTESFVLYNPLINVGWEDTVIWRNVMVTRPRFASTLTKTDEPITDSGSDDIDDEGDDTDLSDAT